MLISALRMRHRREDSARRGDCGQLQGVSTRDGHDGASPNGVQTIRPGLCRFLAYLPVGGVTNEKAGPKAGFKLRAYR
jgi:hypothetical protein